MYNTVYSIKGTIFEHTDIENMLNLAVYFKSRNATTKEINIYVPDQGCINVVLAGVAGLVHTNNSYDYNGTVGNVYTAHTYKPAVASNSEIVLALCVNDSNLAKIEDSNSIAQMLVVPEIPERCDRWLAIQSALNYQTISEIPNNFAVSPLANRCIGWLNGQSLILSSLSHLFMENYIKEATNLLLLNGMTPSHDAVTKQCLLRVLYHRDAYTVAKIMSKTAPYQLSTNPDYKYLQNWVDDVQWERN